MPSLFVVVKAPRLLRSALIGLVRTALLGLLGWVGITPGPAQLPAGWSSADIGNPKAGADRCTDGEYTLTGAGTGLGPDRDQIHFTSATIAAGGNFRLIARLAGFDGPAGSAAGLMVRQGDAATGSMGAVAYQPSAGSGASPHQFHLFVRDIQKDAKYPWRDDGMNSAMAPPCWLQLVRNGNNFAVYKSTDGKFWAQVHNASGGVFSAAGPIQVGFFVSSGGTGAATATFDRVSLNTAPVLPYESSWIGNSFSSDYEGYVSGGTTALWVAPDGTCYCTSMWDEGGEGGKSYKNGKVVRGFTLNTGHPYEGSITSDGTHLYYFGSIGGPFNQIYQTTLSGSLSEPYQPMYLQTPLLDPKTQANKMTGLAIANGELYVSDQVTGQVLVVNPSQNIYGAPANAVVKSTTHAIDASGVANPAPEAVYQSAFQSDLVVLTVPGLTVGKSYNVRMHFAEINPDDAAIGKRPMNISVGGQNKNGYDIYAAAGALNKAAVVSFTDVKPDANGKLGFGFQRGTGSPDGWASISGIEILNPDGSPFLQINCGGPAVGSWQTTIHEIPNRAFPFTRPGPIAADKNGHLWIVQEGATFPASTNFTSVPGWGAIKLYDKDGHYLNKEITDVVNPTAVSYDGASDRLLVAENGPAQNIRFYDVHTGTDTTPACVKTFGIPGGVFAGKTPGLIHDPDAGGDARFFGPTGVGLDAAGNIYVVGNSGGNQTDLRAFTPSGTLLWSLFGLEMTHTGDFDPTRGDSDVWTATHHYVMNYSGSKAGGEWKLKSFITDPFAAYPLPPNSGGCGAVYRKINGVPVLYTGGQGVIDGFTISRFSGEQIIPCGSVSNATINGDNATALWIDANGDGIKQEKEIAFFDNGGLQSFDVANNGNIYLAMGDVGGTRSKVVEIPFQGFNSIGAPIYSLTRTFFACPPPFDDPDTGNVSRLRYVGGPQDTMYLLGRISPRAKDGNYGGVLGCYDHWSTIPIKRFVTVLPDPATDYNFLAGLPPYSADGFVYEAFDVANGIAFCSDLWGTIRVVDPEGKMVMNMVPGPEVDGSNAWEDENMGVRAHYNAQTGEYDVLQENSGFRAKENFYRWKPKPQGAR